MELETVRESRILCDDVVTHITNFVPRSDWFAFQLVSKQFLWCARNRRLTTIKPNYADWRGVCQKGNCQSLILLFGLYEMDPSANNNLAMFTACYMGYHQIVALLLADPRVDPAANDDNIAIQIASMRGHDKVVILLLADPRVDPSALDNKAIRVACENGHREVVALLLADSRVDPSAYYNQVPVTMDTAKL